MTPPDKKDMRVPLARVRGLGAAGHGADHWWRMRLTSLALIPLTLWFVAKLLLCVGSGDYQTAIDWLKTPFAAVFMCLLIGVGFHHAANGLQVVIEDYVHRESAKTGGIIAVKFLAFAFAAAGIFAVVKIALG